MNIRQSISSKANLLAELFLRLILYPMASLKAPWYSGYGGFKDYMIEDELQLNVSRARGHARQHFKAHPKEALVIIIFYAIILLVLLVLAGPTTAGGSGIFGNATVANNVRNAAATLATLTVVVGLLVALSIITDIL